MLDWMLDISDFGRGIEGFLMGFESSGGDFTLDGFLELPDGVFVWRISVWLMIGRFSRFADGLFYLVYLELCLRVSF